MAAVVGGVLGYVLIEPWQAYLPYMMVVAASSFVYVAVADLIPQLQKRLNWRETALQIFWIAAGLVLIGSITSGLHGHEAEAGAAHGHGATGTPATTALPAQR